MNRYAIRIYDLKIGVTEPPMVNYGEDTEDCLPIATEFAKDKLSLVKKWGKLFKDYEGWFYTVYDIKEKRCIISGVFDPNDREIIKENTKESKIIIEKMMTLSTAHIKPSTAEFLDDEKRELLIVYPKLEYGWFIYLNTDNFEVELKHIPKDLAKALKYAQKSGCDLLCLDCDGLEIDDLPIYDW